MSPKSTKKERSKNGRERRNIMISPTIEKWVEEMAKADRRSVSNLLEVLIDAEWKRRGLQKVA